MNNFAFLEKSNLELFVRLTWLDPIKYIFSLKFTLAGLSLEALLLAEHGHMSQISELECLNSNEE